MIRKDENKIIGRTKSTIATITIHIRYILYKTHSNYMECTYKLKRIKWFVMWSDKRIAYMWLFQLGLWPLRQGEIKLLIIPSLFILIWLRLRIIFCFVLYWNQVCDASKPFVQRFPNSACWVMGFSKRIVSCTAIGSSRMCRNCWL